MNILKHGKVQEFTHVLVPDLFPLELTIYAPRELGQRPRSSTDGKPIVRLGPTAVLALIEREHHESFARYRDTGLLPPLHDDE